MNAALAIVHRPKRTWDERNNVSEPSAPVKAIIARWPEELADFAMRRWHSFEGVRDPTGRMRIWPSVANDDIKQLSRELDSLKLDATTSDGELIAWAERCANLCQRWPDSSEWIASRVGVPLPQSRTMTSDGRRLRLECSRWWRRKMRAHFGQSVENSLRSRGMVRRGRAAYCTDWALDRRQQQKTRLRAMMQEAIAINEEGEQFELFALAEKSIANPAVRRAELMTRIRGFEEIATECGHVALFGTATAPSAFHPQLAKSGANPLYNNSTVRDAQKWLTGMWAKARAKLHRLSIQFYGFRIAEPHHDGTPHWHFLFFVASHALETLQRVIRDVWLSDYADERGASEHRCNFKLIDPEKGSAAGYVAKYVAKNIDGFRVGNDDEANDDSTTTAHRVEAWASTHRIRQFQQIGGAPVGLWRELRRIREPTACEAIERVRVCADQGDWRGFVNGAGRLSLWKEQTGECNSYREAKPPQVIGVQSGLQQLRTRLHEWRVQWKRATAKNGAELRGYVSDGNKAHGQNQPQAGRSECGTSDSLSSLGPVSITVRAAPKNWRDDMWKVPTRALCACGCRECRGLDPPVTYEGALKWMH